MKGFKITCIVLAVIMAGVVFFAGCTGKDKGMEGSGVQYKQGEDITYPLETDVTLRYWKTGFLSVNESDRANSPFGKELAEKTGVNIKYIHPVAGQEKEQFNLMLASGDMPDIVEWYWFDFPGGPNKAISDGYVTPLNDLIDKYSPNLKKYLANNPEIDKMVKTDDKQYYAYPFIRGDDYLTVYQGPMMRKDWLDDLGLQVPSTIDEWETVLRAFKEKKGAKAPLTFHTWMLSNGAFVGAYGINKGFYVEDGTVKYGPVQPEYKEFLSLFRRWFAEGLLDNDIATLDGTILDADIMGNKSGATVGNLGGAMGKWLGLMKEKDPKFDLVGVPYPTLNKGDKPKFGQKDLAYTTNYAAAITKDSKHKEIAAMLLDYGYSEQGAMVYNFGVEGESYTMADNYPTYTELVTKNPEGMTMSQVLEKYSGVGGGPYIQDRRYMEQWIQTSQQAKAFEVWKDTDQGKYTLPRVIPTMDESSEMARIMNDVGTYVDEMLYKFIMGVEPMENFDNYISQIKNFNIDRALEIQQNALERYENR